MVLAPPFARLFSAYSISRVTNTGGSGGYFEGALTGPGGEGQWLFALPDATSRSDSSLMVSIAEDQALYIGRLPLVGLDETTATGDADTSLGRVQWVQVDLADHGASITDHWHVVDGSAHWLAYAVADSADPESKTTDLWLVRVDTLAVLGALFSGASTVTPAEAVLVYTTKDAGDVVAAYPAYTGAALVSDTSAEYSTNDHFAVVVDGGVAVALWHNDGSAELLVVTVDTSTSPPTLGATTTFLGSGLGDASTTGSARRIDASTWAVMVPDSVAPDMGSGGSTYTANTVTTWETDTDFDNAATSSVGTLAEGSYHIQMPSFLPLPSGEFVVAYKRLPAGASPVYTDGTDFVPDWGDIAIEIRDPTLVGAGAPDVVLEASSNGDIDGQGGNRPHLSRWGRWLVSCWDVAELDGSDSSVSNRRSYFRLDLLEGS